MINQKSRNIIFLITAILLIFIGISCVSATNSSTNTEQEQTTLSSVQSPTATVTSNRYVNVNTGNDGWDGTSPTHTTGTVGPKQHISQGLGVSVNSGNLYIAAGTYKEFSLLVNKNLTISGASKTNTIIDGMGYGYIFYIKTGTNVIIKNLNMTNGRSPVGGGIYNKGTLTIDNCIFYNNRAIDASDANVGNNASLAGNGGAIYNTNTGRLTITNSEFSSNHAGEGGDASPYHSSPGGAGGAIYNLGIITNIQACTFRNNYAGRGGASSAYHDGSAGGPGGAIYNTGTINNILSCTFTTNHAGDGGSVKAGTAPNGGAGGSGGAIYSPSNKVTVNNSTFNGNYAGNGGDGSDLNKGANGGSGGAIWNNGGFTITNSQILNNKAGDGGDAWGLAYGGNAGNGGAIWNSGNLNITNCEINNNKAGKGGNGHGYPNTNMLDGDDGMGGGIYNKATLTISNSKIHDNSAENGGGIYNTAGTYNIGNAKITNTSFAKNVAQYRCEFATSATIILVSELIGGEGGAIWNNGALTLMNNTFTNNNAIYGGSIYFTGSGTYSMTNCSFINNNVTAVDEDGKPLVVVTFSINGGWKTFISATIKDISKSVFISKISPKQGIASIVGDILDIVNLIDPNVDAVEAAGGAICMMQSIKLTVNDCAFTNNTASIGGGICNLGSGTLTVLNSEFIGNAAGLGGALYSNDLGPLNVTNNIFNGNCAHGGGAISYTGNESSQWGTLNIQENIFSNNDASLGGAVYDNFQGNTHIYMNFNRIYGTDNYDIYDDMGKADVQYNWWGSNNGPSTYNAYGSIDTSPYMILTIKSPNVYIGDNSTITFDMLHDSNSIYQNPAYGVVPDGIPISLTVSTGTITPSTVILINGMANATYIANGNSGPVTIMATVDNNAHYPINSIFNVNKIPTKTYLNSVSNFAGQSVTLVAKVTDNSDRLIDGGNVTFNINIAPTITVPVVNGYAEYYLTIPVGTQSLPYPISADYIGTYKYASSATTGSLYVNQAFLGSTGITVYPPINGTQGQTVNLVARLIDANNIQPLANKNMTFSIGGNNVGSAITDANGIANLSYRILLAPGSYTVLASFIGDSPYSGSSNTGMLNVMPSPTGVSDLTITRKVQSIVRVGDNFVVTIKIGNKGPDIAKDVVIKFTIPQGLEFITASVDQGNWSYDKTSRLFTWNLGDVEVGDPTLSITLKATRIGEYLLKHLLTTASYDPNLGNQMIPLSIVISSPEDNGKDGSVNGEGKAVNVSGKTIEMQKTGLPIAGLILAILIALGGLSIAKRK